MPVITKALPSAEYLLSRLQYDRSTGGLTWSARTDHGEHWHQSWTARFAGKPAGVLHSSGYIVVVIDNAAFKAHRLIWKMVTGVDPSVIDHINGVRSDNRLVNLRDATVQQNNQNIQNPQVGKSGYVGVTRHIKTGKWIAQIRADGSRRYLGSFANPEAAHAAYLVAKAEFHSFGYDTQARPFNEDAAVRS